MISEKKVTLVCTETPPHSPGQGSEDRCGLYSSDPHIKRHKIRKNQNVFGIAVSGQLNTK